MLNLLLVEDSSDFANSIRSSISGKKELEISIDQATSINKAKESLQSKTYDVIILDLDLPDSSGIDTLKSLLENTHDKAVIVISKDKDFDSLSAIKGGAQDYLNINNISTDILVQSISYAIERNSIVNRLNENQALFDFSESITQTGMWTYALNTQTFFVTKGLLNIFDVKSGNSDNRANYAIKDLLRIIEPKTRSELFKLFRGCLFEGKNINYEFSFTDSFEKKKSIRLIAEPRYSGNKKTKNIIKIIGSALDITKEKNMQKYLEQKVRNDKLTGLYNRNGFFSFEEKYRIIAKRNNQMMFLLYASIAITEDTTGKVLENVEDQLICDFADILKKSFRKSDILARIGEVDFIVLGEIKGAVGKEKLVTRLIKNLDHYNKRAEINIVLSNGIEIFNPKSMNNIEGVMKKAKNEMEAPTETDFDSIMDSAITDLRKKMTL